MLNRLARAVPPVSTEAPARPLPGSLRDQAKTAEPEEKSRLEQRVRDLNTLLRETRETALVLERYYTRRYYGRQKKR